MEESKQVVKKASVLALVVRTYWFLWGYLPVLYYAKLIMYGTNPNHKLLGQIGMLVTCISIMVVRYIDIKWFNGETAEGKPATMADFKSYAIKLSVFFLAAWGLLMFAAY